MTSRGTHEQPVETTEVEGGADSDTVAPNGYSETPFGAPVARELPPYPGPHERLMTARQVAARLGVSTALVYKLCERNELGSLRIGGALRFRLAATGRATSRHDAIRAASGAVSRDDAEADVDDLRSRAALQPALVEALQEHARCLLADALPVDGHRRQ